MYCSVHTAICVSEQGLSSSSIEALDQPRALEEEAPASVESDREPAQPEEHVAQTSRAPEKRGFLSRNRDGAVMRLPYRLHHRTFSGFAQLPAWLPVSKCSIGSSMPKGRFQMSPERCARCDRKAPSLKSQAILEWDASGQEGDSVICPNCLTEAEQQVMNEDMTGLAEKVRENRLRRMADRQGYRLTKSRRRDPRAIDYGSYWLADASTNGPVLGEQWGTDLDEIEELLNLPTLNARGGRPHMRVPECGNCGRAFDKATDQDQWRATIKSGFIVGSLCPTCRTAQENAEAVINEATILLQGDH